MKKNNITAIVNTRNEAENIRGCLESLAFADEIVVVDTDSTDETVNLAREYTDRIFSHPYLGYVEPVRNFAISKASNPWVLIVDADERIPTKLADKLVSIAKENSGDYVRIPRKNIILGKWMQHSRWWPDYNIRFFKKGKVVWQDAIHSVPNASGVCLSLDENQEVAIVHHHYQTIDQYLERGIKYSRQQAKELIEAGYEFDSIDIVSKPVNEFNSRFFAGEGYKDGLHGLVLALLQAFMSLITYLYVWQDSGCVSVEGGQFFPLWQKALVSKGKEIQYWFLTTSIVNSKSKINRFINKIKRKTSLL